MQYSYSLSGKKGDLNFSTRKNVDTLKQVCRLFESPKSPLSAKKKSFSFASILKIDRGSPGLSKIIKKGKSKTPGNQKSESCEIDQFIKGLSISSTQSFQKKHLITTHNLIHVAACFQNYSIDFFRKIPKNFLRKIINKKADPCYFVFNKNPSKWRFQDTCLHIAVRTGNIALVKFLLTFKEIKFLKNANSKLPIDLTRNKTIIKMLKRHGKVQISHIICDMNNRPLGKNADAELEEKFDEFKTLKNQIKTMGKELLETQRLLDVKNKTVDNIIDIGRKIFFKKYQIYGKEIERKIQFTSVKSSTSPSTSTFSPPNLSKNMFQKVPKIFGRGRKSSVSNVKWIGSGGGINVCIKEFRGLNCHRCVFNELKISEKLLSHPNVLKIYGVVKNKQNKHSTIVSEKMCSNLFDFLREIKKNEKKCGRMSWPNVMAEKIEIMEKMVIALNFVHSRGIVHRNINPFNFLIEKNENSVISVKICDFKYAKVLKTDAFDRLDDVELDINTCRYLAPESIILIDEGRKLPLFSNFSDVFSLGVLFWEILNCDNDTGALGIAYSPIFNEQLLRREIKMNNKRPNSGQGPKKYPEEFDELLQSMWDVVPEKRRNSSDLMDWFVKNKNRILRKYCGTFSYPITSKYQTENHSTSVLSVSNGKIFIEGGPQFPICSINKLSKEIPENSTIPIYEISVGSKPTLIEFSLLQSGSKIEKEFEEGIMKIMKKKKKKFLKGRISEKLNVEPINEFFGKFHECDEQCKVIMRSNVIEILPQKKNKKINFAEKKRKIFFCDILKVRKVKKNFDKNRSKHGGDLYLLEMKKKLPLEMKDFDGEVLKLRILKKSESFRTLMAFLIRWHRE